MGNVDVEHGGNHDFIQETVQTIVASIEEQNHTNRGRSPFIHKVHSSLRNLSARSFNPRVVSIGPLHRNKINVHAFQVEKATYLKALLNRLAELKFPQDQILGECVKKVKDSIGEIKACYQGLDTTTINDLDFVKMMVMDACFILEFVYSFSGKKLQLQAQSVSYDLVLLENQIPFFVLNDIFQCTIFKIDPCVTVIQLISELLVFVNLFKTKLRTSHISIDPMPHHILSILHRCYEPQDNIVSEFSNSAMHSVVELDRAGVNFKPNSQDTKWAMAMEVEFYRFPWYWDKPTLRMPVLNIHHFTESVLRNLIAYEQSSGDLNYITSYAMAMDMLVNTQDDIAKLVQSKVLVANMSSNSGGRRKKYCRGHKINQQN
ncbi:putative UPF0481 protein At3g02645 [Cynara cardunculus var. scolymus]|uniref:putative UPF0481 protein At3g02645 n=1 Tax=Cynara cardunculus var. scolymus TaxID=59895 RepID=UPI000D62CB78|nr:putative UPF0481 protein At3g02645 [Cynara cardunculus var. scolymus]